MDYRWAIPALLALQSVPFEPASARLGQDEDELALRLVAAAERSIDEHELHGLAIGVAVGSDLVMARGWGRVYANEVADEESPFRAGSLSQQLITLGILDLVDNGALKLDDDVSEYLGELKYERAEITLLDVLRHSSGLPDAGDALLVLGAEPSADEVLAWLPSQPLQADPGSCLVHSGINTLLLSLVLERATELSVREWVEERVIGRMELDGTTYCYDGPPLCTNVVDLVRLQRAIAERELVSEAGLAVLTADAYFPDGTRIRHSI